MFRVPLERRRRTGMRAGGTAEVNAKATGRLYDAFERVAAAVTIGDPVTALSALDALDAESAVIRGILTAEAHATGHVPLIDAGTSIAGGKVVITPSGDDAHAIRDGR